MIDSNAVDISRVPLSRIDALDLLDQP